MGAEKRYKSVTFPRFIRYNGNMDRSGEFYREYRDRIFSYIMRLTGDHYLSGDIMQESFTRYYARYGKGEKNPKILYRIARNVLIDHLRKRKMEEEVGDDTPDRSEDAERRYVVKEEYQNVLKAIQKLNKDDQNILALVLDGEFSYRDISDMTGFSETNVKVRVHRARVTLKKLMMEGDA